MLVRMLALAALLGGCAGSVERVRGLVSEAPDWYEERRVEIRGEGYPDVAKVPDLAANELPGRRLNEEEATLGMAEVEFLMHPRSEPAPLSATEDMLALRATLLARFEPVSTPPDILTDDEIRALRAVFDKYPSAS